MKNIHDNPVEIIKSIYVIKNDINKLNYVGQAIDPAIRFKGHCKKRKKYKEGSLDSEIQRYGKEHFWFEVLEKDLKDYNLKEKEWIKKLNTLKPNGYNILGGGDEPPCLYGIEHPNAIIKDQDYLEEIRAALECTTLSFNELSRKYHINKKTLICINSGKRYRDDSITYPLRKVPNTSKKIPIETVQNIINLLKTTYLRYEDICSEYGISIETVKRINNGDEPYKQENETYPIRKSKISGKRVFTYDDISEIHYLLKETKMSNREIARKFNVAHTIINMINTGASKKYKRENEKYPLRKF